MILRTVVLRAHPRTSTGRPDGREISKRRAVFASTLRAHPTTGRPDGCEIWKRQPVFASILRWLPALALLALIIMPGQTPAAEMAWVSPPVVPAGSMVFRVVSASMEDPVAAGRTAAQSLKTEMGSVPLRAVIVSECFEDLENKKKLFEGLASVLPKAILLGGSTYGSFSQSGACDLDAVCLLGIGGDGVSVSAGLVTELGTAKLAFEEHRDEIETRLRNAGTTLAARLRRTPHDQLCILLADAHSPKNQPLVEGVQGVLGRQFPITGGCAKQERRPDVRLLPGRTLRR